MLILRSLRKTLGDAIDHISKLPAYMNGLIRPIYRADLSNKIREYFRLSTDQTFSIYIWTIISHIYRYLSKPNTNTPKVDLNIYSLCLKKSLIPRERNIFKLH